MPTKDVTIEVVILEKLTVTAGTVEGATIKLSYEDGTNFVSGTKVAANTKVVVSVVNAGTKELDTVLVNGVEIEGNIVTVTEDTVITVTLSDLSTSSIAEVKAAIDAATTLDEKGNKVTDNQYMVSGVVKSVTRYNSSYHSYTLILTDGENDIEVYSGSAPENETVSQGDIIVVMGYGKLYNTTYELADHNGQFPTILSIEHPVHIINSEVVDAEDGTSALIVGLASSAKSGETVTFAVEVTEGYELRVTVNGSSIFANNEGEFSFVLSGESDVVVTVVKPVQGEVEATFSFVDKIESWNNTYTTRSFTSGDLGIDSLQANIVFSNANKQNGTITDIPVMSSKKNDQYVTVNISGKNIKEVIFNLREWSSSKLFYNVEIEYTTNGTTWTKVSGVGHNGNDQTAKPISAIGTSLTASNLPAGVTAVRLYIKSNKSDSNVQVGIDSVYIRAE